MLFNDRPIEERTDWRTVKQVHWRTDISPFWWYGKPPKRGFWQHVFVINYYIEGRFIHSFDIKDPQCEFSWQIIAAFLCSITKPSSLRKYIEVRKVKRCTPGAPPRRLDPLPFENGGAAGHSCSTDGDPPLSPPTAAPPQRLYPRTNHSRASHARLLQAMCKWQFAHPLPPPVSLGWRGHVTCEAAAPLDTTMKAWDRRPEDEANPSVKGLHLGIARAVLRQNKIGVVRKYFVNFLSTVPLGRLEFVLSVLLVVKSFYRGREPCG